MFLPYKQANLSVEIVYVNGKTSLYKQANLSVEIVYVNGKISLLYYITRYFSSLEVANTVILFPLKPYLLYLQTFVMN